MLDEASKDNMLTPKQAAEMLAVSPRKIYDLCASRELPGFKFGRSVRVLRSDVEAYIERCRIPPPIKFEPKLRLSTTRLKVSLPGEESEELARTFRRHGIKSRKTPRNRKQKNRAGR